MDAMKSLPILNMLASKKASIALVAVAGLLYMGQPIPAAVVAGIAIAGQAAVDAAEKYAERKYPRRRPRRPPQEKK